MKKHLDALDGFFFARRSAWPFGLMRIAWAGVTLAFLLMQSTDITSYYSDSGFLPRDLITTVTRSSWYFSILTVNGETWFVQGYFWLLCLSLFMTMIGVFPRVSTILSYILLASLHERMPMILGGGDTVLRNVGFILMLSPGIHALSVSRIPTQWKHWKSKHTLLPPVTMPAWPYRLLLGQFIILYASSLWWKLLGDMWIKGIAVGSSLHHPIFIRWSYSIINRLMPFAMLITWSTLLWEGLWLLLLIPRSLTRPLPSWMPRIPLRRLILAGGVLFHGSIALIMDVGSFSFALFSGYLGLLDDSDRAWLTRIAHKHHLHPIILLFDGQCRLCTKATFTIDCLNTFGHIKIVDLHDADMRKKYAHGFTEKTLSQTVHAVMPNGTAHTGFYAFRAMAWNLPALWLLLPFLYIPGVPQIGELAYSYISSHRSHCGIDGC